MTVYDSLHSLLGHECPLFHCDEWRKKNHCSHTEPPWKYVRRLLCEESRNAFYIGWLLSMEIHVNY
jgi:hypothetical protein